MRQPLDDAGLGHRLQVSAGLAELDAEALDLPDVERLATERVAVDPTGHDFAARLARLDRDPVPPSHGFDRLCGDQREGSTSRCVAVVEVAIPLETAPGVYTNGVHRLRQLA